MDEGIKVKFRPYSEIIENLTNSFIWSTANDGTEQEELADELGLTSAREWTKQYH